MSASPTPAAADNEAHIEVDPLILGDSGSNYEPSGYDTSTASLATSANEYIFENGRRYHAYYGTDKNLLPTDEVELDRLDMHHEVFLMLLNGRLHLAPLDDPQRILDIGTGTGIWAIDMADKYPSAEVIGTDLSPTQPAWIPPNCRFELDDAESDWTFREGSFDYIHSRNIAQGIKDWPRLLRQAYRCMRPGGFIELAELGGVIHSDDNTMPADHALKLYFELVAEAMAAMERPAHVTSDDLKRWLEEAGFVDVVVTDAKQPWGPWPRDKRLKHAGAVVLLNSETGMSSYGMAAFTRVLGMTKAEAEAVCQKASKAANNRQYHVYNFFYNVHGRKPTREEAGEL